MKKYIWQILLVLLLGLSYWGYLYYQAIMSPNTGFDEKYQLLKIPSNSSYSDLSQLLVAQKTITNLDNFNKTATLMKYDKAEIKSGLYKIEKKWSSRKIIQSLRSGKQIPVKLSFNNVRTIANLAGKISKYIEPDSLALLSYFNKNENIASLGLTKENFMSLFIPNTYEVYWDISAEQLVKKMKTEADRFWGAKERLEKADKLGFTKEQVYTLASIVEKETLAKSERSRIAGVYINRIKKGIALQADPTVVFAHQKFDLKRVLLKHLEIDSPYNTYKYAGLPPGPIYMPSISSIDAVLSPESHSYIYFCARPDGSGQHAFAKTLRGHNINAKKYQRWLNQNRIR